MEHFVRLKERGDIAYFEVRGRSLVLYWMQVPSEFDLSVDIPMMGSMPGVYSSAASYVYEYYDKNNVFWMSGVKLTVTVRKLNVC